MARQHSFLHTFKNIFRRRSIIIVSDKSVDHYPVDARLQLGIIALVIGGFSWLSYSTGGYMAAQSVMRQKDQQIFSTAMQNKRIGEEYSLLKQDLIKLQEHDGKIDDYAKFIIEQHANNTEMQLAETFAVAALDAGESDNRLQDRIQFLESQVTKMKQDNEQLVAEVERRTKGKIAELEEVIRLTGLNSRDLKQQAAKELARNNAKPSKISATKGEGGPYIPADSSPAVAPALFEKIDSLLVLNHIVERLPLEMPMAYAQKTSGYGRRIDPFNKRWAMHTGQDYVGRYGAPILATSDGVVKVAGRDGAYGNAIDIDHGFGITTRYAHLSSILVKPGQRVEKGQIIGRQGNTGRSTGSHLHYEVRLFDRPLNPSKFIQAGHHVQKSQQKQGQQRG